MTNKITKIILIGFLNLITIIAIGQDLPNYLTPQEKLQMHDYYFKNSSKGYNYPPFSKVRSAAEWEEIDALIVTWTTYTPVLREIVRNAVNECKVYVVCSDSASVISYLTAGSVNLSNVRYIIAPFNSVWVRDYSANNVYTNDVDSLLLVDWTYNRPRPKDDTLARTLNRYTGIPLYEMTQSPNTLVATGGNFMSDGMGNAFSSKLILNENASGGGYNQNLSEAQIDTLAKKYLGIKRYVMFETLPYDGIHHIDMHTKLLNENTIIFGQYPVGTADGPQIEANLQYMLSNYNSVFGTPYKVIRIPMPPDPASSNQYPPNGSYLTYTNGVFVNKTFLYPTYYAQYDTVVQKIYEKALPGYNVVGINCNSTISASGAIHCITHCIASNDPLLIVHEALKDTMESVVSYIEIKAFIKHRSGIQTATLYYRMGTSGAFYPVPMSAVTGQPDYWSANISLPVTKTYAYIPYQYYIKAVSISNKTQLRPITAPNGYWSFIYKTLTEINEYTSNSSIKIGDIYPNPASAITCIPVVTSIETIASIELFDIIGQKIITIFDGVIPKGNKNYFIDAAKLSKGIYFVKLQTKENSVSQKLIVK